MHCSTSITYRMTSELGVLEMRDHKPDDFTAKLSKGELPNPEQLTVVGMVKAVEGSSSTVSFTNSLKCEHWLSLPIDMVDIIATAVTPGPYPRGSKPSTLIACDAGHRTAGRNRKLVCQDLLP